MNTKELTLKITSLEAENAMLSKRIQAMEAWADDFVTWATAQITDVRTHSETTRVAVAAKSTSSRIKVLAPKMEYLEVKAEMIASGKQFTTQQVVDEAIKRAKANAGKTAT